MSENLKLLTPAFRKQIAKDWLTVFPQLGLYRAMHLMRRTGPLLTGVLLQVNDSNRSYRGIAHVHNLAKEFPVISLTLAEEVPHEYVKIEWHAEKYQSLAEGLRKVARVPLQGIVRFADVLEGYWGYLDTPKGHFQLPLLEDVATLAACGGDEGLIRSVLGRVEGAATAWADSNFNRVGGRPAWIAQLRETVRNRPALLETVEKEAIRHKTSTLPREEMIF